MGFRNDAYAKIWKKEDKGKYHLVNLSISKKNKESGEYETCFSDGTVRFIGTAHEQIKALPDGARIKLKSVDVTNRYDKDRHMTYVNYCVFAFEPVENGNRPVNQGGYQQNQQYNQQPNGYNAQDPAMSGNGFIAIEKDDLPF